MYIFDVTTLMSIHFVGLDSHILWGIRIHYFERKTNKQHMSLVLYIFSNMEREGDKNRNVSLEHMEWFMATLTIKILNFHLCFMIEPVNKR